MSLVSTRLCALTLLVFSSYIGSYAAQNTDACSHLIKPRASWGASPPRDITKMSLPVANVVIHHADGPSCSTPAACMRVVKGIQTYHMNAPTHKWSDIGYSFLVGGDGLAYEGRGWARAGAHSPGYNDKSIGICFLGNFTALLPPPNQLKAVKNLIECGVTNGLIIEDYKLYGHRDVRHTTCPGNRLYKEISGWPHKAAPLKNKY